ncbi:MAG: hypothetical protein M1822_007177 [Bathelium mastoideum]|nr:MAG: hypothetical protein M1822_007177 [Bathelium mastoideum]
MISSLWVTPLNYIPRTAPFNYTDLDPPVPYSIFERQLACTSWWSQYWEEDPVSLEISSCPSSIGYKPFLIVPSSVLQSIDPAWATCSADVRGEYDPPYPLTPYVEAATLTSVDPWSSTSVASPASSPRFTQPKITIHPSEPSGPKLPDPGARDPSRTTLSHNHEPSSSGNEGSHSVTMLGTGISPFQDSSASDVSSNADPFNDDPPDRTPGNDQPGNGNGAYGSHRSSAGHIDPNANTPQPNAPKQHSSKTGIGAIIMSGLFGGGASDLAAPHKSGNDPSHSIGSVKGLKNGLGAAILSGLGGGFQGGAASAMDSNLGDGSRTIDGSDPGTTHDNAGSGSRETGDPSHSVEFLGEYVGGGVASIVGGGAGSNLGSKGSTHAHADTGSDSFDRPDLDAGQHAAGPGKSTIAASETEEDVAVITVSRKVYTAHAAEGLHEKVIIPNAQNGGSLTLVVGGVGAKLDGQSISLATSGVVLDGSTHPFSGLPAQTLAIAAKEAEVQFTDSAGHTHFAVEDSEDPGTAIVDGSLTLTAGAPATIIAGQTISLASSSLMIDRSFYTFSSIPTFAGAESEALFTDPSGHGHTALEYSFMNVNGKDVAILDHSITLTAGGAGATLSGQTISLAPSGIVVDGTGYSFSIFPVNQATQSDAIFTDPSGKAHTAIEYAAKDGHGEVAVVDKSLTLSLGGPAETVDGEVLSLAADGMVVDGKTIGFGPVRIGSNSGSGGGTTMARTTMARTTMARTTGRSITEGSSTGGNSAGESNAEGSVAGGSILGSGTAPQRTHSSEASRAGRFILFDIEFWVFGLVVLLTGFAVY